MFTTRLGKEIILSICINTCGKEIKSPASNPNPEDQNILSLAFTLLSMCHQRQWDLIQSVHVDDFLEHLKPRKCEIKEYRER